jgi:hypothetical protein
LRNAKKLSLPLIGHVPVRVRTREAANAGQRSIEHQIGLRGASMAEDDVMEAEEKYDIFAEALSDDHTSRTAGRQPLTSIRGP